MVQPSTSCPLKHKTESDWIYTLCVKNPTCTRGRAGFLSYKYDRPENPSSTLEHHGSDHTGGISLTWSELHLVHAYSLSAGICITLAVGTPSMLVSYLASLTCVGHLCQTWCPHAIGLQSSNVPHTLVRIDESHNPTTLPMLCTIPSGIG